LWFPFLPIPFVQRLGQNDSLQSVARRAVRDGINALRDDKQSHPSLGGFNFFRDITVAAFERDAIVDDFVSQQSAIDGDDVSQRPGRLTPTRMPNDIGRGFDDGQFELVQEIRQVDGTVSRATDSRSWCLILVSSDRSAAVCSRYSSTPVRVCVVVFSVI
jgi:hypothetical protein